MMMGIGMQHHLVRLTDGDMARPEQQVTPLKCGGIDSYSPCCRPNLLITTVAGAGNASGLQRELYKRRAIKPFMGAPAKMIGAADKTLGDTDEITCW